MEPDEIIKHLEDIKRGDLTASTKLATFYENYRIIKLLELYKLSG